MADALRFMMPPIDRWLASHGKGAGRRKVRALHGKARIAGMFAPEAKTRIAGMSPRPRRRLHDGFDRRRDGNVQPLHDVARARAARGRNGHAYEIARHSPGRAVGIA
jgi:hypothetical protein